MSSANEERAGSFCESAKAGQPGWDRRNLLPAWPPRYEYGGAGIHFRYRDAIRSSAWRG